VNWLRPPRVGDIITLTAESERVYRLRIFERRQAQSFGVVPFTFVGPARVLAVDAVRMVVERANLPDQPTATT
jgi:hypothetical protein